MVGFHFFGKYFKDEGVHPIFVESMTLIMRLNGVCKTFIFTLNWSLTVLVQCRGGITVEK